MGKSKQPTYSQALTELEQIAGEIEAEDVDIDILADKIKRAAWLIQFCKGRLRSTEEDVKKALSGMEAAADDRAEEEGPADDGPASY
ncbi:MAG: exodeoxyribonuclease VII small subunit [Nitrospirae bacterium]|nr:exodeoxyribonuclease VII small subunit [Nitrospirota bacterium]